jgi:class 3 adenylate cyclase
MSVETLELGRDAYRRHAWQEAAEALSAVERSEGLSPEDLELHAESAWWSGQPDAATESFERAFARYLEQDDRVSAARVALLLSYLSFRRLAPAVAAGWLTRAERLLEGMPDSAAHAWLEIVYSVTALFQGRVSEAIDRADRAMELARAHGSPDVDGLAVSFKGLAEIGRGRWQEGLSLVDEAAAAASSGQIGLRAASDIYCNTIAACRDLGDYGRAGQWTDEAERWMRRDSAGGYPGVCRVHRAELKMLRGLWPEAEQEARRACEELEVFRLLNAVGFAYYEIGEVRLRMGDLAAAAEAFDQAYAYGHDAQPGLALLQAAEGDADGAALAVGRALAALEDTDGTPAVVWQARLLPAQAEIALARGDHETARNAVEELEAIAANVDRPAFRAAALSARGEVLLHTDRPGEALPVLGKAWRLWAEIELPYESARARLLYGKALIATGDSRSGRRDLRAARTVFERLGATLDLRRVDAMLGTEDAAGASNAARVARTFMFTDIVTSSDLIGLIGDEAWDKLLRWHDRELRSSIDRYGGEEVKHTGDGFFVAFSRAIDGIECAVDVQRRLAAHRDEHGFAPRVRIGLHAAEASRQGRDYSGGGVHIAARIGAAAGADEILVSSAVVDQAGRLRFALSDPRVAALKGIEEPVKVRTVAWR